MPTVLNLEAIEKGSLVISGAFIDENSAAVIPKTIVWTLIDADTKMVINEREQVEITPAATINILLQGNDLAILHGKGKELREVIVEWTYDGALGNDIPQKDRVRFYVLNLSYPA
jgi:hypothetical protein